MLAVKPRSALDAASADDATVPASLSHGAFGTTQFRRLHRKPLLPAARAKA